jgi:small subunit ribosomal protein S12e
MYYLPAYSECLLFRPEGDSGPMDVHSALQEVLKTAITRGAIVRGLHEAAKALDKRQVISPAL